MSILSEQELSSPSKPLNQIPSLITSVIAMYSASVVDNATTGYNEAFLLIALPPKVNTYPVSDLLL